MSENSKIGWTGHTWNPVTGCTKVSPGCEHCYAEAMAKRWKRSFDVSLKPQRLNEPYKWEQPAFVFVNSLSDLFHIKVPDEYIRQIWDTMVGADWHIYQVLTKRPHRMAATIRRLGLETSEHIWLGTSVENQDFAENRIPALLSTEAPVRWISAEPLLGPLALMEYLPDLAWVVTGGESGPGRRPAEPDWFRSARDQCAVAGTPFFHKQGNNQHPGRDRDLDGRTWNEYPDGSTHAHWQGCRTLRLGVMREEEQVSA